MYEKVYRRYDQAEVAHYTSASHLAADSSTETFAYADEEEVEHEGRSAFAEYQHDRPITPKQYAERYDSPLSPMHIVALSQKWP